MTTELNEYKIIAQTNKAAALSDMLYTMTRAAGELLTPEVAAAYPVEARPALAQRAGVKPPSEETWTLVVTFVRIRGTCYPHRFDGAMPVCLDCGLDPFARL